MSCVCDETKKPDLKRGNALKIESLQNREQDHALPEDYPRRDDANWLAMVKVRDNGGAWK